MKTGINSGSRHLAIAACLILALAAVWALADEEAVPLKPSPESPVMAKSGGPTLLTMTEEQALKLSPLHQEMRQILILEKSQLAELYEEFERETDSQRALAVQHRIHEVKTGTEISLLKAQAKLAREQGRTEDADILEDGIEKLSNPERGNSATVPRNEKEGLDRN